MPCEGCSETYNPIPTKKNITARRRISSLQQAANSGMKSCAVAYRIPAFAGMTASKSPLHQRGDMRGDRARQALQIVAAFQHRDDAAARRSSRRPPSASRHPGEIGLDQIEIGERIARMRVEAGRNHQQVRLENRAAAAGSRSRRPRGNASPPSPARSGALTMVSCSPRSLTAPVPG